MNDTRNTTKPSSPPTIEGAMGDAPLLSIGIPLYRAAAFYDTIVENIDSIDYPNVEILISDRHLADDTIDRLGDRYRGDRRVKTYRHDDEGAWWENWNFLLNTASGKYFRWLPQDDLLPRTGLDKLIERIEKEPEVILVYNRIDNIDSSGHVVASGGHDVRHAGKRRRRWRYWDALSVAAQFHHQAAGVGIVRRDAMVAAGLSIRPAPSGLSMLAFRYALARRGRFEMVKDVVGYYRWHADNYSHYTPRRWRDYWGYFRVARSYDLPRLDRLTRLGQDIALLFATVVVAPTVRMLWNQTPTGRLARRTMKSDEVR